MELIDSHHRKIDYLRLGVTDRCNLRCRYCMPEEGIDFSNRSDLLSYEEIIRLAHIFRNLGVTKIRLTGGEPFVRKDIGNLLKALSEIFPSLHITTNATLLEPHLDLIKKIKVSSLNISLDTLDVNRFFLITRRDEYQKVMDNILACIDMNICVKLNMVVMQGINDVEIKDFIKFGRKHGVEVRFIEAMPFNADDGNKQLFIPAQEMLESISQNHEKITPLPSFMSSSQKYQLEDGYIFGIIPAYTRSLCGTCNRIRLTPKGEMLNCLYSKKGTDLLSVIRNANATDLELRDIILQSVMNKLKNGHEEEALSDDIVFRSMTTIGG